MNEEEVRYRVSAVDVGTLQIVVQVKNSDDAKTFFDAIDIDKWTVLSTEY